MKASGTGVGASAVIDTVDSATQVTLTVNSTANGSNTITFKCPADTGYDVFGKNVSGALKLFLKKRASILTANTMTTQDGVEVLSTDSTLRWLGAVITSATDGQADWDLSGQRRFRLWNRDNRRSRTHCEAFVASGTWYKPLGIISATADVRAPGGGSGDVASTGDAASGGTTSFGSHASATGGAGSLHAPAGTQNTGTAAAGTGSGGDKNITGGGFPGGPGASKLAGATASNYQCSQDGGPGGQAIKTLAGPDLGATETVTIGTAGQGGGTLGANATRDGEVDVSELVEF
jgi:hypothetical protein